MICDMYNGYASPNSVCVLNDILSHVSHISSYLSSLMTYDSSDVTVMWCE